jgi:methylated-DNA-[protein]-cysteine S-methyltransferase
MDEANMTTCFTERASPLGTLLLAATDQGLSGLYFEQHRYFARPAHWMRAPAHPQLQRACEQLDEYFAGSRNAFDLPLDLQGTPFQRAVWDALLELPLGATSTYRAIAQRVDRPAAVRAAGSAIGRNPVSIIVPCHRVLGVSGALSGYAGGLERKRFLLALESGYGKAGESGGHFAATTR